MSQTFTSNTVYLKGYFNSLSINVDSNLENGNICIDTNQDNIKIEENKLIIEGAKRSDKVHTIILKSGRSSSSYTGTSFNIITTDITELLIDGVNKIQEFNEMQGSNPNISGSIIQNFTTNSFMTIRNNYTSIIGSTDDKPTINGIDISSLLEPEIESTIYNLNITISPIVSLIFEKLTTEDELNIDGCNSLKILDANIKINRLNLITRFSLELNTHSKMSINELIASNCDIVLSEHTKLKLGNVSIRNAFNFLGRSHSKLDIENINSDLCILNGMEHSSLSIRSYDSDTTKFTFGNHSKIDILSHLNTNSLLLTINDHVSLNFNSSGEGIIDELNIICGDHSKINLNLCVGRLSNSRFGNHSKINISEMKIIPELNSLIKGSYTVINLPRQPTVVKNVLKLSTEFLNSLTSEQLRMLNNM